MYKKLVVFSACFTFLVIVVGAYVRLSDAGLGCPDWPGCYGHIAVPMEESTKATAQQAYPDKPIHTAKAWKEMGHRYLAGILGLLILAILISALRKSKSQKGALGLPIVLSGMVLFQATLGMWTVTLLLKPVIVTAHLLGGMIIFSLLIWHAMQQSVTHQRSGSLNLKRFAFIGIILVFMQIMLGGWVSSNYAALACSDFPLCHQQWVPKMDFENAFHIHRELGMTVQGTLLSHEALTAIHWIHRVGALIVFLYLGALSIYAIRSNKLKPYGIAIMGVLLAQISLGVANVLLSLPLSLAVAHNAGAALLLATMVAFNFKLRVV